MPDKCKNTNPLKRDGLSQVERILAELKPSFAKIFEWEHEDWCRFVYKFASILKFFPKDDSIPPGYWSDFYNQFGTEERIQEFLRKLKKSSDTAPHVALLMAFVQLLDLVKDHMNELTKKHLDFYYRSVLRLKNSAFAPDQAHIVFEGIKNSGNVKVAKNSVLKAIKDPDGNQLYYKTKDELIVNEVQVAELKTIFHNPGTDSNYEDGLYYAAKTNTQDGLEVALDEGFAWNPFASKSWPKAAIGFSIASSILKLKEGDRSIYFKLMLKKAIAGTFGDYKKALQVQFTGEQGWIGPYFPTDIKYDHTSKSLMVQVEVAASEPSIVPLSPKVITEQIKTDLPVARFQFNVNGSSVHQKSAVELLEKLQGIEIDTIDIGVDVRGMKENILENDYGPLEPSKPFMPFGPHPTKGNNLFVGNSEIFDKDWKNLSIDVTWKDLPIELDSENKIESDLTDHYYAYRKKFLRQNTKAKYDIKDGDKEKDATELTDGDEFLINSNADFKSDVYVLDGKKWTKALASTSLFEPLGIDEDSSAFKSLFSIENNPTATDQQCSFLPEVEKLENKLSAQDTESGSLSMNFMGFFTYYPVSSDSVTFNFMSNVPMYYDVSTLDLSTATPVQELQSYGTSAKKGFIKIALQSSFYHKLYPVLYALAMVETSDTDIVLPNEPYTPFVEALSLNYQACISDHFNLEDKEKQLQNFGQKIIQVFHEGPFGFAQQHNFLKNSLSFLDKASQRRIYLEPFYPYHGEFFIGFVNAKPQQTVSLLMQFAVGSEDPLAFFDKEAEIKFWILGSNEWRVLEKSHILENTSNDFLQPGIFKFVVPREATSNNSILPPGLIWMRVTMPPSSSPDSICKLLGVYSQVVVTEFYDQNNNRAHLQTSMPAKSISKMVGRPAGIKSVTQPYNSFNGKPEERSSDFYKRVSERLRHKQRAVTIWDYEALVLEAFPELHKVKCLNHTYVNQSVSPATIRELYPGHVTLVLIPDLNNKNAFNPLQPRVSRNTLEKVNDFLVPICSKQVTLNVINPFYEEVELIFKVLFHTGFDPNYYSQIIQTDLVNYLSPWMGSQNRQISFDSSLNDSMVIHFIDSLKYVDMITDFSMKHHFTENGKVKSVKKKKIIPTNAAAILVSKAAHQIEVLDKALIC